MEFRILGPLELIGDRGAVQLGGSKPRALLTMLLLHANEAVSAERLAIALWDEQATSGAARTVQVYVSRLRKALGDDDVLTTTPVGYRLRVGEGDLDARLDDLVALANEAPVVKLMNLLLLEALEARASDVHGSERRLPL